MNYTEIKEKYDQAVKNWEEYKKSIDHNWDFSRPYEEYRVAVYDSREYENYSYWITMEKANRPNYKLRKADDWEEELAMPVNEFIEGCRYRMFTDDDGNGYYGTADEVSDISVDPSEILKMKRDDFPFVYWYNK